MIFISATRAIEKAASEIPNDISATTSVSHSAPGGGVSPLKGSPPGGC